MASVTVPGPNGPVTQHFNNDFNFALAQSISNALAAAGSNLFIQSVTGSGTAPTNVSGKVGELFIDPGSQGSITIPAAANYQFVVDDSAGPDTIFGSPGLSIMGGGGDHTVIDPAVIALGDTSSGSSNNVTINGAGDNVAVGDGTNTLTGTGSGTMSGGTGTNTFIALGSYLINSEGFGGETGGDTIIAGGGSSTVNATGPNASVVGAGGELFVTASGTSDSVVGGGGETHATLTGSDGVVSGNGAVMSVFDGGTDDTINAGQAATSVTAPGGSFVNGGSGDLNFVGGTGPSTIMGGSGNSTVFGNTGATSLFGGAGGAFTYVNTTAGGLSYQGGDGSETIDASLSKGFDVLYGGADPTEHALLMGGAGDDNIVGGQGADTLVGNGGHNAFFFFTDNGGSASSHVIADFSGIDNALLLGYGPTAANAAIAGATVAGGSTTITLSDNTKITFSGITDPGALTGHVFSN